jgi:hypothetical protein
VNLRAMVRERVWRKNVSWQIYLCERQISLKGDDAWHLRLFE